MHIHIDFKLSMHSYVMFYNFGRPRWIWITMHEWSNGWLDRCLTVMWHLLHGLHRRVLNHKSSQEFISSHIILPANQSLLLLPNTPFFEGKQIVPMFVSFVCPGRVSNPRLPDHESGTLEKSPITWTNALLDRAYICPLLYMQRARHYPRFVFRFSLDLALYIPDSQKDFIF